MASFNEGDRVRVRHEPIAPSHLRGRQGTVGAIIEMGPGSLYNLRLDAPVSGRLIDFAIPEEWLEGDH